jgi:lipopolysaccharide transport system ATP-binding protein
MPENIITVNNISKLYRLGMAEKAHRTFREAVMNTVTAPVRNFLRLRNLTYFKGKDEQDILWALKNISFEVKQGEALGIIGKNGSGKSTLLKILSRITDPSEGYAEIHGKVSTLLEVGTGFNPELTGRENIYLNGAILGMKKQEISRKFNDIVAFSEIGKHIDTQVKRYSSGMYVRLAFAVAAYLEPDILLVDEVLAVGDIEFQKKCLGKMGNLATSGKTVLFISHNMMAIKNLCQRTILLNGGKIIDDGPTHSVIARYLSSGVDTSAERKWDNLNNAPGDEVVRLLAVRARNNKGEISPTFNIQEPINIEIDYIVLKDDWVIDSTLDFKDESGLSIFITINYSDNEWHNRKRPIGIYRVVCNVPGNLLNEGTISISSVLTTFPTVRHAYANDAISFHIYDPGAGGARGDFSRDWPNVAIRPLLKWQTIQAKFGNQDSTKFDLEQQSR